MLDVVLVIAYGFVGEDPNRGDGEKEKGDNNTENAHSI